VGESTWGRRAVVPGRRSVEKHTERPLPKTPSLPVHLAAAEDSRPPAV